MKCAYCQNEALPNDYACSVCLGYSYEDEQTQLGDEHERRCDEYRRDCLTNDPSI